MTGPVELSPGLLRLRAANPSPLTGTGTNTYIVGTTGLAVIDPGPDLDSHMSGLLGAIAGRRVDAIVVTHAHLDHSALVPRLARATGAEVLAFGRALDGVSPRMATLRDAFAATGEGLDLAFAPDRRLADDDHVAGPDWTLRAIHTPGHLGSHICLALDDLLFSGDHVMGWATSVVSPPEGDMGDYMASLRRLALRSWRRLLPGHGDLVEDPASRIADLITHRENREAQILDTLQRGPARASDLASGIYVDIPAGLLPAATRNVLAHLIDLESRLRVTADPSPGLDARFRLT